MRRAMVVAGVLGAASLAVLLLKRALGQQTEDTTDAIANRGVQARQQVLTGVSTMRATVARMKSDPAYRPGEYGTGKGAPRQAEEALKDAEIALEGIRSEGDA